MIVFFSGTGNSRYVAQKLAELTKDELCDAAEYIREKKGAVFTAPGNYIFVSPVYASAPPRAFLHFIRCSQFPDNVRAYFVMTCAGGMGGSPVYCRKTACEKGFAYLGTSQVLMPQNYLLYFKTFSDEENRETLQRALPVIQAIAAAVTGRRELPDPGTRVWEYLLTEMILGTYYSRFMRDKAFRATESCISCGRCQAVCPLSNIRLEDGRPVWCGNCTHCMACINLCPKRAIEYGRLSVGKRRYTGPDHL